MSDYLLSLSRNPFTRSLVRGIGMPAPRPLARASAAYEEHPFNQQRASFGGAGFASAALAHALAQAGAEAYAPDQAACGIAVFDASSLRAVRDLKALYDYFHVWTPRLAQNARVLLVCGAPEQAADSEQAAVWRGVEGFTRSLAKEIGRRGATANLLVVEAGAQDRLEGPLRFFASPRSTYVSGQALRICATAAAPERIAHTAPLHKKVALITGAARGIGAATAKRLAVEGAHVICVDLPCEELETTARDIQGQAFAADLTLSETPARIAQFIAQEYGGVDVIVHNAGITRDKTIAKMQPRQWEECLAINLEAVIRLDRALEPLLRDGGRVTCLSSIAGIAGNVGQTNYASAKAGIIGYVAAQAQRLASRGICVNAIAPGYIETRLMLAVPFLIREFARRANSLSQGGVPLDAAELITFLSTPGAYGINGQTVRVCGQNLIGA